MIIEQIKENNNQDLTRKITKSQLRDMEDNETRLRKKWEKKQKDN